MPNNDANDAPIQNVTVSVQCGCWWVVYHWWTFTDDGDIDNSTYRQESWRGNEVTQDLLDRAFADQRMLIERDREAQR